MSCRPLRAALLAWALLVLPGCLEVVERWTLDDRGGGRLELTVLHDASLLRQVRSAAGERPLVACGAREVPLSAAVWREVLQGAEGIEVRALEEGVETGGWHRFHLELGFRSLADVARLEPFRARPFLLEGPPEGSEGDARRAHLRLEPFRRVPLVDPYLALLAAPAAPPAAPGVPAEAGWRERFGIAAEHVGLLTDLLDARLGGLRLECEVVLPGPVLLEAGLAGSRQRRARIVLDREALADPQRDRALDVVWRAGELDRVTPCAERGDAPRPRLRAQDAPRAR